MKLTKFQEIIENNFVTKEDKTVLDSLFESRINSKKPINLFVSFTFLTPNYRAISILNNISKILKLDNNIKLHIVLSDANMFNQEYIKSVGLQFNTDYDNFIKKQIEKISSYLLSFGVKSSQIRVYTFSEIWGKILADKNHHFLINYYSVISKTKLDNQIAKTFARFFQFSSDIFFSVILQHLYPELNEGIDLFFGRVEKEGIYSVVRSTLYSEGVSKIKKPYLIYFKPHPELIYNNRLPEWNMSFEEIFYIIENVKPSKQSCIDLLNLYEYDLTEINLFLEGKFTKESFQECLKIIEIGNDLSRFSVVASTLFQFLQERKCEINEDLTMPRLNLHNKEEVLKITKLLKTKHILEILRLCDGDQTTSSLAKQLKLQISNVSSYLNQLKNLNLIKVKNGKYSRTHDKITINLEN